jgi:hypothetical protein
MVLIYLTMGDRSAKLLTGVIMSVLCLVISGSSSETHSPG